jgi:hypothetical protein
VGHGERTRRRREMDPGEQTTGTRDEQYNLVSVLYHTLKAADICDLYALDAEAGGRKDLYEFFREAQVAHTQLAERAKELLGIRVEPPPGAGIVGPQAVPEEVLPPEDGLPPEAPPESDLPVDFPAGDRPTEGGTSPELVPGEDVAGPAVPPDAPRTGEVPPRTGEFPPSPSSEPPPRS